MKKNKILIIPLAVLIAAVSFYSCSDDTTTPITTGNGSMPNINIKNGSLYRYTNDSLSIGDSQRTAIITTDTVLAKGTYYGYSNSSQVHSISRDTVTTFQYANDTFYVSYDNAGGKFYQYGLTLYVDPNQTAKWDKVADFSLTMGTQWMIDSFQTFIGGLPVDIVLKGKVIGQTTIQTTASPSQTILCYRIELTAAVSAFGLPLATIYIDYYLGYTPSSSPTNPSGPVRIRLNPFEISEVDYPGFDQILQTYRIP